MPEIVNKEIVRLLEILDGKKWAERYNGVFWSCEIPWLTENRLLRPLSLPHTIQNVNRKDVKKLISESHTLVAYWSDLWDNGESAWWWTSCDNKVYDIENITDKNGRRDIRKGLRECTIQRLEPADFVEHSYPIYSSAFHTYEYHDLRDFSKEQYSEYIFNKSRYPGYELWGAFVHDKMAAYASAVIMDNAVLLDSAKSDGGLQKHCPNNALFYLMTKHYLVEREKLYITNGPRTLLHPTNINDMLIRMGYRKIYCRLNLELSMTAKLILLTGVRKWYKYLTIFRDKFPGPLAKLQSFLTLVEISRTFKI